jgi:hypothetical protein
VPSPPQRRRAFTNSSFFLQIYFSPDEPFSSYAKETVDVHGREKVLATAKVFFFQER